MTVTYRGYQITNERPPIATSSCDFQFSHEDFDGPGDNRYGHAATLAAAKECVDEQIDS